ncbi:DUF6809 family protein [Monoglobus pectinilyticus]
MQSILHEFCYDNINPNEQIFTRNSEYNKTFVLCAPMKKSY